MALFSFNFPQTSHLFDATPMSSLFRHPACFAEKQQDVVETDSGYLITSYVPGTGASDVSIKIIKSLEHDRHKLRLSVKGSPPQEFRLPGAALVDIESIRASCIDGVLRVVVPKLMEVETIVQIASEAPVEGDASAEGARTLKLNVPGFSPTDLAVVATSRGVLSVKGKHADFGDFSKSFEFDAATFQTISAWCVNGVLHLQLKRETSTRDLMPTDGDVADIVVSEDASTSDENAHVILSQPVPGHSASDFTVEVVARRLKVTSCTSSKNSHGVRKRSLQMEVKLAPGVDPTTVKANVCHGLLKVTSMPPADPEEVVIPVSASELACLSNDKPQ